MGTQKYIPKKGVFEATLGCNLRCRHCGSSAGEARADELTTGECADLFKQLAGIGMEWLTISGGEPMVRDDWAELIALSTTAGIRTGMITNAIALDLPAARLAKENGLRGIGFSVDGLERTHDKVRGRIGHFNRLMEAMDHCREVALPFSVVTTLNNDNLDELEQMHTLFAENKCYAWQVQLGSDMGNMRHHPTMLVQPRNLPQIEKRLVSMLKKRTMKIFPGDSLGYFGPHEHALRSCGGGSCFGGCAAGMRNIGIESNGNIKGCLSIMPGYNEDSDKWVEGNIRQAPLAEIWNRPGAFAYNREWTLDSLEGFCNTCGFAQKCRGGCIGKRISDGNVAENRFCTYRVLVENKQVSKHSAQAAAVILAGVLGMGSAGCQQVDDPNPDPGPADSDTNDNDTTDTTGRDTTGRDTTDTAIAPVYGIPEYGIVEDSDTFNVDEYGIMPDTTDTGFDTMDVTLYGFVEDTDSGIPIYGMVDPNEK